MESKTPDDIGDRKLSSPAPEIPDDKSGNVLPNNEEEEVGVALLTKSRHKFCTTSSVYTENTLSNPNNDHVSYCIGAVMQAQIFDDHEALAQRNSTPPAFHLEIPLDPQYGGPTTNILESVLMQESMHDLELRQKLLAGVVPTVDTMFRFIAYLTMAARYSPQCNIIALVYLNRITGRNGFALTMENWRGLWTSCIILAQKVWDDKPLRTSSFTQILPNVSKDQLRELEMKAFQLMDYTATVKPSIYAKYYFELRALFGEITKNDPRYQWNLKPLTLVQGMRLEDRSCRTGRGMRGNLTDSKAAAKDSPASTSNMPSLSARVGSASQMKKYVDSGAKTLEDLTYTPTTSRYVLRL